MALHDTSAISIFYGWQSDLSSQVNKNFIGETLDSAAASINAGGVHRVRIERGGPEGTLGTARIDRNILDQIDRSEIAVFDVSAINNPSRWTENDPRLMSLFDLDRHESPPRISPNPNIGFELGYAVAILGWDRCICVLNEQSCTLKEVFFDLDRSTVIPYNFTLDEKEASRKEHRRTELARYLSVRIAEILKKSPPYPAPRAVLPLQWIHQPLTNDSMKALRSNLPAVADLIQTGLIAERERCEGEFRRLRESQTRIPGEDLQQLSQTIRTDVRALARLGVFAVERNLDSLLSSVAQALAAYASFESRQSALREGEGFPAYPDAEYPHHHARLHVTSAILVIVAFCWKEKRVSLLSQLWCPCHSWQEGDLDPSPSPLLSLVYTEDQSRQRQFLRAAGVIFNQIISEEEYLRPIMDELPGTIPGRVAAVYFLCLVPYLAENTMANALNALNVVLSASQDGTAWIIQAISGRRLTEQYGNALTKRFRETLGQLPTNVASQVETWLLRLPEQPQ